MSTDYRFAIKRKADNKKIGEFYFNRIKNYYDIDSQDLKLNPENISCTEGQTRFTIDNIESDIASIHSRIDAAYKSIFEKKMMISLANSKTIKEELESDIFMLNEEIKNLVYAFEAASGLYSVLMVIVEDAVKDGGENDSNMAYCYNAEGLPKTAEGYAPHIWLDDVYVEAQACI